MDEANSSAIALAETAQQLARKRLPAVSAACTSTDRVFLVNLPGAQLPSGPWFCVVAKHFPTYICHPPSSFHEPSGSNGQIAL